MASDGSFTLKIVQTIPNVGKMVDEIELLATASLEFELLNGNYEPVKCTVTRGVHSLIVSIQGYGTLNEDGDGTPVVVDVYHHDRPEESYNTHHPSAGHAMVAIWENINLEEPRIHTLAFARNEHYRGDNE